MNIFVYLFYNFIAKLTLNLIITFFKARNIVFILINPLNLKITSKAFEQNSSCFSQSQNKLYFFLSLLLLFFLVKGVFIIFEIYLENESFFLI